LHLHGTPLSDVADQIGQPSSAAAAKVRMSGCSHCKSLASHHI
jgi:hypothetical protein